MRKKILLLTLQAPRMPGMGGEVRAYYLIRTATELGDVTLISLGGPDGNLRVQPEIAAACEQVLQPADLPEESATAPKRSTRMSAWWRLAFVLLFPWRNRWHDFLTYFVQYCPASDSSDAQATAISKRILSGLIRCEFHVLSRWCSIPPITCFLFDRSYRRLEHMIDVLCRERSFDLLWVEQSLAWPFAEDLIRRLKNGRVPVICSAYNVESQVCKQTAEQGISRYARWYWGRQQVLMTRMECRAYRRSRLVIQCSENDAQLTREMAPTSNVLVVGNGVNVAYFQATQDAACESRPTILFTAGFGYGPNREAAELFACDIFPLIRQRCPEARFLFAGSQAQEVYDRLQIKDDSIQCVSDPADIRPYFQQSLVYVVPLRVGGGTRLKILEAMAMRRPVVSTRLGAEGIPYVDGKHLLLADDANDFAESVVQLIHDPELRTTLTENAAEFVKQNYDWEILCESMRQHLQGMI